MTGHRQIETFRIEIPRAFAYRLLGIKSTSRPPRRSVVLMIDQEFAVASTLVDARAVMRHSHAGLLDSAFVDRQMPLVAVVCTIGAALEERVSELSERGEAARAVILDAIGSAAAEEVADQSNRLIRELAAPTDYRPDRRRSPGYGNWDVREQAAIFRFLEPADIGVGLNEHFMMTPRKSVSYVVPLADGGSEEWSGERSGAGPGERSGTRSGERPGQGPGERSNEEPGETSGDRPSERPADGPRDRCAICGLDDCPYRHDDDGDDDPPKWLSSTEEESP